MHNRPFHPHCDTCCQTGRCHFCLAPGRVEGTFEKDGERYAVRLCPTHASFVAGGNRPPVGVLLNGLSLVEVDEPLRKSEAYQSTVLSAAMR